MGHYNNKFSLLMSVYFKEKPSYLSISLDSILSNTVLPNEIVLVKDGPLTAELENVIQEYVSKYKGLFKIIQLEVNQGLGNALNIGLKYCSNNFVARMDTDDICVDDRFERQLKFLSENSDISVVGGAIREFETNPTNYHSTRLLPVNNVEIVRYLKYRCPFNHMTVMFRKNKVLEVNGYQDFYFQEDYYLWIRMHLNGCKFSNLKDILVYARAGEDMLGRRGGWKYVKSETKLLAFMLKNRILNYPEYLFCVISKSLVRLMGKPLRKVLYKNVLRK